MSDFSDKRPFPRPKPKDTKSRQTVSLSQVLPQVTRDLALDKRIREFAVVALWDQVVGEAYRDKTRAVKLFTQGGKRILMVRVRDAATAGELSFSVDAIRERLNGFSPQTGITIHALNLKIGTL